ncbi:MAG: phosphoribosylamine--glycine ligase [Alphaproteobacteria bacterium]
MRFLVVGSGGREHALCWSLAGSPLVSALFCAPGNPGIADHAQCVPIRADDIDKLVAFAEREKVDLVVVGPEAPLAAGLVDRLQAAGIRAFGPTAAAARLESSKAFAKEMCVRVGAPTAAYGRFTDAAEAKAFVQRSGAPIVVKADGLAGGKGVIVAMSVPEAEVAIDAMLAEQSFGAAGAEIVVEQFLEGEEVSFFALCDGRTAQAFASAQDHKAAFDGDTGPNTGGMGAYSPAPVFDAGMEAQVMESVVKPIVRAMADDGAPFVGILFVGLMLTADGPQVLEFNVRFGDPEAQVLMMRLKSDLAPALLAAVDGMLDQFSLRWRDDTALCVVMAANGYPSDYRRGTEIRNLEAAGKDGDVMIFHAGTARTNGKLVADGGRVLGVTARARTVAQARDRAYEAVAKVDWPDGFWRTDIGWRALEKG